MAEKKDKELIEIIQELDNHSGEDYSGEKLTGIDLQGKDFSKANLSGCNFLMSNMCGCDFSSADLTGANFTDTNLAACQFEGAKRKGKQILKYGSIVNGKYSVYGFLVRDSKKTTVLVNEANIPEYEYTLPKAKHETKLLYNLLVNG